MTHITLTAPQINPTTIKEKITCIRGHRERIFRVEKEVVGKKTIFHNYGHGGAGWTFLFGCVHESIRQFEAHNLTNQPIIIIGAGCYGLLTAIILARKGYTVTIIARETENIPSTKAAGFFFPRPRKVSTPHEIALFTAWGIESYRTYLDILAGKHPFITHGPRLLPAYYDPRIDPGFAPYVEHGLMKAPHSVTINFGNDGSAASKKYEVIEYQTLFMNTDALMQELRRNLQELAIPLITQELENFNDLPQTIIFNCAGLGAKKLADDVRVIPVQGHLITLKNQPSQEHFNYMLNVQVESVDSKGRPRTELIYYAPKQEGILGITFIRNQDSLTANEHEFDRLLDRCQQFFGQQKS